MQNDYQKLRAMKVNNAIDLFTVQAKGASFVSHMGYFSLASLCRHPAVE